VLNERNLNRERRRREMCKNDPTRRIFDVKLKDSCPYREAHTRSNYIDPYAYNASANCMQAFYVLCPCGAKGPITATAQEAIEVWLQPKRRVNNHE